MTPFELMRKRKRLPRQHATPVVDKAIILARSRQEDFKPSVVPPSAGEDLPSSVERLRAKARMPMRARIGGSEVRARDPHGVPMVLVRPESPDRGLLRW
jgi:hypothetical protein